MRHNFRQTQVPELSTRRGFTIIELLIVIVVIGILAAITVVAYTGIQSKAADVVLKSDLKQAQTQLELDRIYNNSYPATKEAANGNKGLPASPDTNYEYTLTSGDYCLTASSVRASTAFNINSTTGILAEGLCTGHAGTGGGGNVAFDQPNNCPSGFIPVPGNNLFSTQGGFCTMKYEAKQASATVPISQPSGTLWATITQTDAIAYSPNVAGCTGCHLITEAEWLTIAHNVLSVDSNWSGGTVGSGYIYSGHNDNAPANALAADTNDANGYYGTGNTSGNQRRTLTLTNSEVIWDLAGNVWEWTAGQTTGGQPGVAGGGFAYRQWNAVTTPGGLSPNPFPSYGTSAASSWTSSNGIGVIYSSADDATSRSFSRGGAWTTWGNSGVLTLNLYNASNSSNAPLGFRVAR